jgi:tRNA (guanine9-N1)-methyltransferase
VTEKGLQENDAMFVRSTVTVAAVAAAARVTTHTALDFSVSIFRPATAMENDTTHSSEKSISPEITSETVVLSKKAQKRALKITRREERKMEHRAKEKAAKKEKKRKRAERLAAGEQLSEDELERQKRAKANQAKEPFAARVVLDLGFDDKMSDKVRGCLFCCFTACRNGTVSRST